MVRYLLESVGIVIQIHFYHVFFVCFFFVFCFLVVFFSMHMNLQIRLMLKSEFREITVPEIF